MKLLSPIATCQTLDIRQQYEAGVRYFDLRVEFNEDGSKYYITHNIVKYKHDLINDLKFLNSKRNIYCRVTLDYRDEKKTTKEQIEYFKLFCNKLSYNFVNITFVGGYALAPHKEICDLGTYGPHVTEVYSSVSKTRFAGWCPWLFAKRNNKRLLDKYQHDSFLMIDFIK